MEVVQRVRPDIEPRAFFEQFVATRRPCLIDGLLTDPSWRAGVWTDAYLAEAAGSERVHVEVREHAGVAFGRGRKVEMPFGEFVRRAGEGDERLYLSAQPLPEDDDGPTELHAPPLRGRLARDVPLRPALLGRLVPQQLNVWMGSSRRPSSSGLHHDFHDNLYVLLRGSKRFGLFPPSCAERMSTAGAIERVHANGLISYAAMPTRLDGLARELERAGRTLGARGSAAGGADLAAAQLEAAEAALDAARASGASAAELSAHERAVAAAEEAVDAAMDSALDGDFEGASSGSSDDEDEVGTDGGERLPDNFCSKPAPPDLRPLEVELRAGQMLYLPASWFHEVRSCDGPAGAAGIGHLALNYWLHPPSARCFERPYAQPHWQRRFDRLFGGLAQELAPAHPGMRRSARGRLAASARRAVHPLRRRPLARRPR